MAGLSAAGLCVSVGPPLSASEPSLTSTSSRKGPNPQEPSSERLKLASANPIDPKQLNPVRLSARMVLRAVTAASGSK